MKLTWNGGEWLNIMSYMHIWEANFKIDNGQRNNGIYVMATSCYRRASDLKPIVNAHLSLLLQGVDCQCG